MGRPRTISDESLLDAARNIFLRDGAQASTAEIARSVGVSEGLIFKRFATKEELFHACFDVTKIGATDLQVLVGKNEIAANIALIAREQVAIFRRILPCVLMRMTHGGIAPKTIFSTEHEPVPVRLVSRIARYFEAEMALGRLRSSDPWTLARVIVGSTQNLVFFELAGLDLHLPTDERRFADSLSAVILDGIRPDPHVASPPAPTTSPAGRRAAKPTTSSARTRRTPRTEVPDAT
jgi:AcrR family transcriptional regulator